MRTLSSLAALLAAWRGSRSRPRGRRLGGARGIAVEPAAFDFGKVQPEKTLEKEFVLRNLGDADLVIENVSTTCGCTVAGGYSKVVKPGGSTPLRVTLHDAAPTFGRLSSSGAHRVERSARTPRSSSKVEATVGAPAREAGVANGRREPG